MEQSVSTLYYLKKPKYYVKADQVKAYNEYFDLLELKVSQSHNHLLRTDHEVTAEKIKLLIEGKLLEAVRTILPVFKEQNYRMKLHATHSPLLFA